VDVVQEAPQVNSKGDVALPPQLPVRLQPYESSARSSGFQGSIVEEEPELVAKSELVISPESMVTKTDIGGKSKKTLLSADKKIDSEPTDKSKVKGVPVLLVEEHVPVPDIVSNSDDRAVIVEKDEIATPSVVVEAQQAVLESETEKPGDLTVSDVDLLVAETKKQDIKNEVKIVPVSLSLSEKKLHADRVQIVQKVPPEPDLQSKIKLFLDNYIKAYEQRNITLFSSFFAVDAIENGKPIKAVLSIYSDLFDATSDLSLSVEKISWQEIKTDVAVKGKFDVFIRYNDSREISGTGSIRFLLVGTGDEFRVSVLEYEFDTGQ
jgi:hypothetical protein